MYIRRVAAGARPPELGREICGARTKDFSVRRTTGAFAFAATAAAFMSPLRVAAIAYGLSARLGAGA